MYHGGESLLIEIMLVQGSCCLALLRGGSTIALGGELCLCCGLSAPGIAARLDCGEVFS